MACVPRSSKSSTFAPESFLTSNSLAYDHNTLQRVVCMAQYITGAKLPSIQDLYTRQCQRKAQKIARDSSHPSHRLFSLLSQGKQYRSNKSRTKRLLNSFYPQVIRLLNNESNGHRPIYIDTPPFVSYTAAIHCLLYMHSHFTSTYM